ncbi:cytochrome P450 monooxygenase [Aspergillus cavernicola]|uniref:Cytochrome P450 monooxygenase n=1 Tax=Aspergillus cavernicola TaxID=176166 RepID=A0ABR4J0B9_9EURO
MGTVSLIGALTGIATHILLYRVGEWDLAAPSIVSTYIILSITLLTLDWTNSFTITTSLGPGWAKQLVLTHITAVYTSMILYRAFFHRLRQFPGPFLARISNFYATYLSAKRLQLFEETERLHKVHGDYVRLGPTELSIINPEAVVALYGPQSQLAKGPWYHVIHPRVSLQTERDKKEHARRRKVWDQGFSSKAIRTYEPRITKYTTQLTSAISQTLDTEINVSKYFNYYSFDVMGDMAFGKSFDMLLNGEDTYFLTSLHADMTSIGLFGHLTWLFPFFKGIPGLNWQYKRFWEFLDGLVGGRVMNEPAVPDVFSWLLRDYNDRPKTAQAQLNLHGDSYLIVVAGSDTTAATLSIIFLYLAANPPLAKQLQSLLDSLPDLSHKNLIEVDLLDGIINEALRLHPAVPSGTQRVTPPEGVTVGGVHIPGGVIVQCPVYSVFRDERNFEKPTEFLPTRWTTEQHLVKNKAVFIPFNAGPYSCAGKQLALMELRCVTAGLMKQFDVTLAEGTSLEEVLGKLRDTFTLVVPELEVVFRRRG